MPNQAVVPDAEYDKYLGAASDPHASNYWDVVINLPRSQAVQMEAADNVFSLYEMRCGAIGTHHAGRTMHPRLPGTGGAGLQVFGTEGNVIFGGGHSVSVISAHPEKLPAVDDDGWFHIPVAGDTSQPKWPQPVPAGFNYYNPSAQPLIDCITKGVEPVIDIEWGRHITEMMIGAMQSAETGVRYEMTTTLDY